MTIISKLSLCIAALTFDLRGAAAITKLNKNGNNVKWYNDGGMLTIGYKFELK